MKKAILVCFLSLIFTPAIFAQEEEKTERFSVRPTALLHLDGAGYFDDITDLKNGIAVSDVRLGAAASFGKWTGRVDIAFVDNKVGFKDLTLGYNINSNSHVLAGHFFEPFGLSRLQGTNSKFMTMSSSATAFTPGRHLGVAYTVWSNKVWFSGGVFGGKNLGPTTDKGDDGYSVTGRFLFNPLRDNGKILHFGVAGSFRKPDGSYTDKDGNIVPTIAKISSNAGTTVDKTKFLSAEVENLNHEVKFGAELVASVGKFFLQGEYFYNNINLKYDDLLYEPLGNYETQGAYGKIGFLAIGKNYSYNARCGIINRPEPKSLEIIGRFNHVNLNHRTEYTETSILGGEQNDISLAVNYYVSNNLMFRLNYTNVSVNGLRETENFNIIQGRIQVVF